MIGVVSNPAEEPAVREFFELFKTPWEFYRADRVYSVVICSTEKQPALAEEASFAAQLVLIYSAVKTSFDEQHSVDVKSSQEGTHVSILGNSVRINGKAARFGKDFIRAERSGGPVFVRVGYNLFEEVQSLLAVGQASDEAHVPALDLHIELLRKLMTENGVCFVEIPPVPQAYAFTACLTHDLDHPSIRRHKFDSTVGGFLYRATFGSIVSWMRGRLTLRGVLTNWGAAIRLPLTQLGLAKDFWNGFDRYLEIENGRPSTFFVIPFERRPGNIIPAELGVTGRGHSARGSRYDISHVADKLPALQAAGCEIGLHGLDAWADGALGREESRRISTFSGQSVSGVRMHWLYSDDRTPSALDDAAFSYDSTRGYNETVGYRSGTSQVFRPLGAKRLLELPLHVMDTALFYPSYLNLSLKTARERLAPMLAHAASSGGTFTVNWHDRSIAPERLWGGFYRDLVDELTRGNAWFCTGAQAVSWFLKRRSAVFEQDGEGGVSVRVPSDSSESRLPGLRLRSYEGTESYSETELKAGRQVSTFQHVSKSGQR